MFILPIPEYELVWLNNDGSFVCALKSEWDAPCFRQYPNDIFIPEDFYK